MENATEIVAPMDPHYDDVIERLQALETKMDVFIALASDIKNAIEPTLDGLRNSPIGKMLGV